MKGGQRESACTLVREWCVTKDAGAAKRIANDKEKSGKKLLEGKGRGVGGYDAEKGGTADSGHDGSAIGW